MKQSVCARNWTVFILFFTAMSNCPESVHNKSSHLYLYGAFNKINCVKATAQYQNRTIVYLRWPRELNALQLQKTHANRKSASKSRKLFHQFDSRWWKCSQHKQIKKPTANAHNTTKYILFAARFFVWLCCEHLQRVHCQIEEVVFLICRRFSICSALSSLGHRICITNVK